MNLLTDSDRAALPALYATEGQGGTAVCRVRLFMPDTYWQWFLIEFDGEDLCFGLACGHDVELGYISLGELAATYVLRDPHWPPTTLAEVRLRVDAERYGDGVVDFTAATPDEERGGAFGRCPRCGRVGRIVDFPNGGPRHYLHVDRPGGESDRCRLESAAR